jgi:hypothetical protein
VIGGPERLQLQYKTGLIRVEGIANVFVSGILQVALLAVPVNVNA